MPLYIPWLTETIKKRGVRYLLHHYLGQFFEEKLTLDQLSIDIYEGKGSIKDLTLDVDGLNDELDFVPFRFLEGCSIGQISVEVPWSSLATEACRVELDGAKFVCRLKTSADGCKTHCTESTLLSRSLMTSSMQMAEEIVTTEDDEDLDFPETSIFRHNVELDNTDKNLPNAKKKNANQMFEGLEMFAQLIDSVLRRTKLSAHNTLFRIQSQRHRPMSQTESYNPDNETDNSESSDEFGEPMAESGTNSDSSDEAHNSDDKTRTKKENLSDNTVEFLIKFFRCEEIVDQTTTDEEPTHYSGGQTDNYSKNMISGTITKLLTLEDVEMRIDGVPVSNLVGKHTITIKFNGQKSEISIFSGSPLLAVIGHKQLVTFFNVFDSLSDNDLDDESSTGENGQKMMSFEDYAKIENQLLETASMGGTLTRQNQRNIKEDSSLHGAGAYYGSSNCQAYANVGGRRWVDSGCIGADYCASSINSEAHKSRRASDYNNLCRPPIELDVSSEGPDSHEQSAKSARPIVEPTLNDIEAFSCELKLPGIWLCILRDDEKLPPLIKPYADSMNSFQSIHRYIDRHIKAPHIRCLALKVALDITATTGTKIFLGDLDVSEHLLDDTNRVNPTMKIFQNDSNTTSSKTSRYKASIVNGKDITIDMMTSTRVLFDPTIIDRLVYDYKLIKLKDAFEANNERDDHHDESPSEDNDEEDVRSNLLRSERRLYRKSSINSGKRSSIIRKQSHRLSAGSLASRSTAQPSANSLDLSLNIRGEHFKFELLCPIPDLTPEAQEKPSQLRPQSFIFDFKNIQLTWQSDKLTACSTELSAYIKTQPKQSDSEAVRFIESLERGNDKITLILEPSPSNLDNAFTSDIERALCESTLYDSIYVGQATESSIPTSPFQTKRKVVRPQQPSDDADRAKNTTYKGDCDNEKILTPGDRQHLMDYLNQTLTSTKLSLQLHIPICEVEFEDKEQLDLIYNRFGNDFVFWTPKAFEKQDDKFAKPFRTNDRRVPKRRSENYNKSSAWSNDDKIDRLGSDSDGMDDDESDSSFHSAGCKTKSNSAKGTNSPSSTDCYENQMTCKIQVDELLVRFNHQSCAAALKQEIAADNLLVGVVIDVEKKPNTLLSMVAENLELSNDAAANAVLEGNLFSEKKSTFALTAEIKRPTKALKDIKLAIQLCDGLFRDFKTETYSRFWQSINVTDEPILGYQAPQIVTEIHVDILNTSLMLIKDGARPSLLSIDELYLTSMVMEQTSQVMIRMIIDELALYMKRDKKGLELMKNYICLVDSGLIDLNVKFSKDGQLQFSVINNVITVRVCHDSLSALGKLFEVLIRYNSGQTAQAQMGKNGPDESVLVMDQQASTCEQANLYNSEEKKNQVISVHEQQDEMNLLEDAMNDYSECVSTLSQDTAKSNISSDSLCNSDKCSSSSRATSETSDADREHNIDNEETYCRAQSDNTCLLDESNPMLGHLFSQPLVPTNLSHDTDDEHGNETNMESSLTSQTRSMDESAFFVIGDDDVGAGITNKNQQHEPVVRKLIDEPINIIDNHFKMTKPRTLPEILANSLERYVLEEMTLAINLFGGHDFDDGNDVESDDCDETKETGSQSPTRQANSKSNVNLDDAMLDIDLNATSSSASPVCAEKAARFPDNENVDIESSRGLTVRSRTGSIAMPSRTSFAGDSTNGGSGSLRRRARRKHLSEGSSMVGTAAGTKTGGSLEQRSVRFGEGAVNLWESLDLLSSPHILGTGTRSYANQTPISSDSKQAGGPWRRKDVCIRLIFNKIKMLYELADVAAATNSNTSTATGQQTSAPVSWRFMLFVHDIEFRDKIAASDINKMLYEYCTESMPRRSTQFLTIKNVATINQSDGCEECDLRVSLKPLRLNIDQITLLFLIEFFTTLTKSLEKQQSAYKSGGTSSAPSDIKNGPSKEATHSRIDCTYDNESVRRANLERSGSISGSDQSTGSSSLDSVPVVSRDPCPASVTSRLTNRYLDSSDKNVSQAQERSSSGSTPVNHHHPSGARANQQPIYVKSFTFSPNVPIRIDYHAKHLDFEQGALAGILMGLAHLDHSELVLRRVQAMHGMRGLDRVLQFAFNSWLSDIKRNQLPGILIGVGPMHNVVQLFQGMRDLVWMPIDHYRKDGRLVRGLQRGASSFSSSTAMAAINLVNRFISIVQCTAQIAHDIVTPPSSGLGMLGESGTNSGPQRRRRQYQNHRHKGLASNGGTQHVTASRRHHEIGGSGSSSNCRMAGSTIAAGVSHEPRLNQPRNFCEGMAVGFSILKEGLNDTARNVSVGMQAEDVRSAVGELVRQIPSTLLNPIISATEGAQSVLVGIRNQIAPDARREDQDKWKGHVRGK